MSSDLTSLSTIADMLKAVTGAVKVELEQGVPGQMFLRLVFTMYPDRMKSAAMSTQEVARLYYEAQDCMMTPKLAELQKTIATLEQQIQDRDSRIADLQRYKTAVELMR